MGLILNIETATRTCSVALAQNGILLSCKEAHDVNSHASILNIYISEVLAEAGKKIEQLDAVAVSNGPGSYTGLRIGLSAAKGICYALDIPLITINTLESLAEGMKNEVFDENAVYIPLIDARRSEVYYGVYNSDLQTLEEVKPLILDENSFSNYTNIKFIAGNGAKKVIEISKNSNFVFLNNVTFSAKSMVKKSNYFFKQKSFSDVSYSEPNYLKPFFSNKTIIKT
jgi:tRNA threonylcarbamoyladenosine biosynthesis protein TsaB